MKLVKIMLCACLLFVSACSKKDEKQVSNSDITKSEDTMIIGSDTVDSYDIVIKNYLGESIKSIEVKTKDDKNYSDNVLSEDQKIKDEQVAEWFFLPETKADNYNVRITTEHNVYVLSYFPFDSMKKNVGIFLKGDVAFIKYEDQEGDIISTYKVEYAKKHKDTKNEKQEYLEEEQETKTFDPEVHITTQEKIETEPETEDTNTEEQPEEQPQTDEVPQEQQEQPEVQEEQIGE